MPHWPTILLLKCSVSALRARLEFPQGLTPGGVPESTGAGAAWRLTAWAAEEAAGGLGELLISSWRFTHIAAVATITLPTRTGVTISFLKHDWPLECGFINATFYLSQL